MAWRCGHNLVSEGMFVPVGHRRPGQQCVCRNATLGVDSVVERHL